MRSSVCWPGLLQQELAAGEVASPCTIEDAMGTAWIAEAATLSAKERRPVRIDEVAR